MSKTDEKQRLSFKKAMKLLNSFMAGQKLRYLFSVLSIGLAALLGLTSPLVLRVYLDCVIGDKPISEVSEFIEPYFEMMGGKNVLVQSLWLAGVIILLISVANGLFLYAKGKLSAEASESVAKKIKEKLYDHIQNLPYNYHVKAESGDLIQRCTSDVETIRKFLSFQLVEIGRALFMVALVVPIMLSLSIKMTMISMVVIPFIFFFSYIFFIKIQNVFQTSDEAEGKLSNVLQENLSGVRVVRAFAKEKFEIEKFEDVNQDFRDKTYKLIRLLAWYWSLSDLMCLLQIGAVTIAGAYFSVTGQLTLGTFVVFNTYVGMLLWPIRQMGRILTDLGKTIVSLSRINEVLKEKTETMQEDFEQNEIRGEIEFKNVSFAYEEGKDVLKNINFKIKSGQTLAILGQTGSGKSSLVHLLLRLYEIGKGQILIDGKPIQAISKENLRRKISIVLQEPFLFSRTIKENISLARKSAEEAEIFEAARTASVHNVITEFEKGYETEVGEKGVTLSGGQKQRVAIARSIIRNAPVLVFDDSLSAVDTETDALIRERLSRKNSDATNIIISHRVATVSSADLIMVLHHGEVAELGTHDELMNIEGFYKRLWSIQNELEEEFTEEFTSDEYDDFQEKESEMVEIALG